MDDQKSFETHQLAAAAGNEPEGTDAGCIPRTVQFSDGGSSPTRCDRRPTPGPATETSQTDPCLAPRTSDTKIDLAPCSTHLLPDLPKKCDDDTRSALIKDLWSYRARGLTPGVRVALIAEGISLVCIRKLGGSYGPSDDDSPAVTAFWAFTANVNSYELQWAQQDGVALDRGGVTYTLNLMRRTLSSPNLTQDDSNTLAIRMRALARAFFPSDPTCYRNGSC